MTSLTTLNQEFSTQRPKDLIKYALSQHDEIAISFSGAEDVVLIDMAVSINPNVQVFTLDTGRLNPETYEFIEKVRKHYGITIDVRMPDQQALQNFVREKGLFSFYEDGHQQCCGVRKTAPLKLKLATLDAWFTGQRRDQSPGTRSNIELIELDTAFKGRGEQLIKYNPLAHWKSAQVWEYIKRSEEHTSELQSRPHLVCRLLLEKKNR